MGRHERLSRKGCGAEEGWAVNSRILAREDYYKMDNLPPRDDALDECITNSAAFFFLIPRGGSATYQTGLPHKSTCFGVTAPNNRCRPSMSSSFAFLFS
ncbi:hypothetical protein CEXT_517201 [Caerostris extrusa]|uniref:Uncharacterized protein n=1 Tax=Caerostris extrusa TaxID=172846 RepID=A0AAV4N037_CAEEX|nr:hypothetical protein CEXT_517201 [Caerostris extrusa]